MTDPRVDIHMLDPGGYHEFRHVPRLRQTRIVGVHNDAKVDGVPFGKPGELQDVSIAKEFGDGGWSVGSLGATTFDDGFFVRREAGAFVEKRANLTFELANGPVVAKALVFEECALPRIVDADEFDEMCPGEPEEAVYRKRCGAVTLVRGRSLACADSSFNSPIGDWLIVGIPSRNDDWPICG